MARGRAERDVYLMSRNDQRVTARTAIVSQRLVNNEPGRGSNLLRVRSGLGVDTTQNPVLAFNTFRYDELSSVIDFYLLIALGLDIWITTTGPGRNIGVRQCAAHRAVGLKRNISGFRTYLQPGEYTRHAESPSSWICATPARQLI